MMSDESDLDTDNSKLNIYRKKCQLLYRKCEQIQNNNGKLLNRVYKVKKMYKRRKAECKFLMNRLDTFQDDWRNAPAPQSSQTNIYDDFLPFNDQIKTEKGSEKPQKKPTKKKSGKSEKTEKDPNAPKRPANAFFQFCQEQRTLVMEEFNSTLKPGEPELSKQDLTRQLANKWKTLSVEDKQIYVDRYERSKEKYAIELSSYQLKN